MNQYSEFSFVSINPSLLRLIDEHYVHGDNVNGDNRDEHLLSKICIDYVKIDQSTLYYLCEPQRYIVKLFRICFKNKEQLTLYQLLKIAYCIGQIKASIKLYSYNVISFFNNNNLDQLETYILTS